MSSSIKIYDPDSTPDPQPPVQPALPVAGSYRARFDRWILRITHRIWWPQIRRVIEAAYISGLISVSQAQQLADRFDPSLNHQLY
ncbi:hypothetical protein SH661x_000405 [Planctomicrobium sp. SH661]|uniref:hypothetical protein n=1 Tax=Planctomicrobium sp. SH661 TaxID=3448124 RepID=UPI003F5AF7D0